MNLLQPKARFALDVILHPRAREFVGGGIIWVKSTAMSWHVSELLHGGLLNFDNPTEYGVKQNCRAQSTLSNK